MLYNELFKQGNFLFADIFNKDFPDEFKKIFGERLPHVYDVTANFKYGNRTIVSSLNADNCHDVVNAIIQSNLDNWVKAANTMQSEYNALAPVRRTITTDVTGTEKQTSNDNNTTSVKAFNDTDFTPDNKNENNTDKDISTSNNRVETITGFDNGDIQDKIQKDFQFRLDNWRESIIFVLIKQITLDIY